MNSGGSGVGGAAEAVRLGASALLGRVESFLLHPVEERVGASCGDAKPVDGASPEAPIVAVVGLAPRVGTTTLARSLGSRLASIAPDRAAVVWCERQASAASVAGRAARALAKELTVGTGAEAGATGRLVLASETAPGALVAAVSRATPLILEVPHGYDAAVAVSVSTSVILVSGSSTEPALARAAADSLARVGPEPWLVHVGREQSADCDRTVVWAPVAARMARLCWISLGRLAPDVDALAELVAPGLVVRR